MHAFSILTLGIFVAGYSTARWDLTTRVYELAIFAWDHGVVARAAKGLGLLSVVFFILVLPVAQLAIRETDLVSHDVICALGEADIGSILESLELPLENSSSAAGRFSGVAQWRYGQTYGVDARILAIRRSPRFSARCSGGLPQFRYRLFSCWDFAGGGCTSADESYHAHSLTYSSFAMSNSHSHLGRYYATARTMSTSSSYDVARRPSARSV